MSLVIGQEELIANLMNDDDTDQSCLQDTERQVFRESTKCLLTRLDIQFIIIEKEVTEHHRTVPELFCFVSSIVDDKLTTTAK